MTDIAHILLVDDDPMTLEIERHQLGDDKYRYSSAGDGLSALRCIAEDKPEVILLDVVMPELDGIETCRRIRADDGCDDIHIIFVTAHEDEEIRRSAYEAGGDEVLVKPLNPVEIQRKVEKALANRQLVKGLRREVSETMGALMSTLTASGDTGVVMNALRQSLACVSLADLAEVMIKALEEFGLTGSVQVRAMDDILTLNSARRSSPLEQEMLLQLSLGKRDIFDYGNRTAFCYKGIVILVKEMPLDDPETYGRIKDNVALLAEAGEFRLKALIEELAVRRQREALAASVKIASDLLGQADTKYKKGQSAMTEIFDELERNLEWLLAGLVLTEEQERSFWDIVQPLSARATALYDEGRELDTQLDQALTSLRQSLGDSQPASDSSSSMLN